MSHPCIRPLSRQWWIFRSPHHSVPSGESSVCKWAPGPHSNCIKFPKTKRSIHPTTRASTGTPDTHTHTHTHTYIYIYIDSIWYISNMQSACSCSLSRAIWSSKQFHPRLLSISVWDFWTIQPVDSLTSRISTCYQYHVFTVYNLYNPLHTYMIYIYICH